MISSMPMKKQMQKSQKFKTNFYHLNKGGFFIPIWIMKNINDVLQFKIGEESYEREFEIIPIPPYEFVENNLSLEPYEYFGIINEILGINFSSTLMGT